MSYLYVNYEIIRVGGMMERLQEAYPERRDELVSLLDINLEWRMHRVSDGQRRRVQLFLGLIQPFKVLLLDEVTVSLGKVVFNLFMFVCLFVIDIIVRRNLLAYLERESSERGAVVIYATHILDGLDNWPTHIHFLSQEGRTKLFSPINSSLPTSLDPILPKTKLPKMEIMNIPHHL